MEEYNKNRRSIRLKNYDYSQQGMYFLTIVVQNRKNLFGEIIDDNMLLNDAGKMIKQVWNEIPEFYVGFAVNEFVVMPNHIHGIIEIVDDSKKGNHGGIAPTLSLFDIVHRFKSLTTNKYIMGVKDFGWIRFDKKLWQRNYWERVIRNQKEFDVLTEYIINNPLQWHLDKLNGGQGINILDINDS